MAEAARESGMLFMEAMKTRFVPLYGRLKELIASGAIGEIVEVKTSLRNEIPVEKGIYLSQRAGVGGSPPGRGNLCILVVV